MYFSSSFDLVFGVSRFGDGDSSAVGTELELGSLLLVCWLSLRTHLTMLCSRHSVEKGLAWLCLRNQRSHSPVAGNLKVLTGPSCLVCSPSSLCLGRSWHISFPAGFPMHMCLFLPLGFGFCVFCLPLLSRHSSVAACLLILLFYEPCVLLIESWCCDHAQKT